MRRHAGTEIERDAVEVIAGSRRAIGAALLQAADMRIAKIPAARALGEVAAECGEMTDLRRRQTKGCRRNAGIRCGDRRIGGDRGAGGEGADAPPPVWPPMNAGPIPRRPDSDTRAPPEHA